MTILKIVEDVPEEALFYYRTIGVQLDVDDRPPLPVTTSESAVRAGWIVDILARVDLIGFKGPAPSAMLTGKVGPCSPARGMSPAGCSGSARVGSTNIGVAAGGMTCVTTERLLFLELGIGLSSLLHVRRRFG